MAIKGKILDKDSLYMTIHVGEAGEAKGDKYHLATMIDSSPIVTSEKTDKRFNLSWNDIVNMAVDAGVDN